MTEDQLFPMQWWAAWPTNRWCCEKTMKKEATNNNIILSKLKCRKRCWIRLRTKCGCRNRHRIKFGIRCKMETFGTRLRLRWEVGDAIKIKRQKQTKSIVQKYKYNTLKYRYVLRWEEIVSCSRHQSLKLLKSNDATLHIFLFQNNV